MACIVAEPLQRIIDFFTCGTLQKNKQKLMGSYIKKSHKLSQNISVYLIPKLQRWSPRGRPWPRGRPRRHIFKSLALASKVKSFALASKPQVLENCPVLEARGLEDSTIF